MFNRLSRLLQFCTLPLVILVAPAMEKLSAQSDLLPIDHPASKFLTRMSNGGFVKGWPVEHLPRSRSEALAQLKLLLSDTSVQGSGRRVGNWYLQEIAADCGEMPRRVVIPTGTQSSPWFHDISTDEPFTGIEYVDTISDVRISFDPYLEAEARFELEDGSNAIVAQGGVQARGSLFGSFGFSARASNGTIIGDEEVVKADPRYGQSFKFGLTGINRDIDFGSGHARFVKGGASVEIGREYFSMGAGGERTLLFGARLPSQTDYVRFGFASGPIAFSHVHASLLADPVGDAVGINAEIPDKFAVAHLVTVVPSDKVRFSLGESLIYSGRSIQIGYLNPVNFLKSQEHFLRDRDNSALYATATFNPVKRIAIEGEFLLDDLVFSNIGSDYWGNKTAWRVEASMTQLPVDFTDVSFSYTHLEPYVYSHFNPINNPVHDGAISVASGLDPNSWRAEGTVNVWPFPRLIGVFTVAVGEHGANPSENGEVVRNVGGDVRRGFDSLSSETVKFLDGDLEENMGVRAEILYEIVRNVYCKGVLYYSKSESQQNGTISGTQAWIGVRVGAW